MIVAKYLVIGAGLAGASIAWRLAQSRAEVAILDQDLPGSVQGNSHGSARIFRYTGHNALHAGLVKRARAGWAELEAASGNLILHRNGALDFGAAADVRGLAYALARESIEHEVLSAAAAGERWPAIRFDSDVLWHPDAAVVDAEVGVWSMVGSAQSLGAQLATDFEVTGIETTPTGYRVNARDGRVAEGAEVIIATGRHLPLFAPVPDRLQAAIRSVEIRQGSAFYFPYSQRLTWGESLWPTTVHKVVGREIHSVPGRREAGYAGQQIYQISGGKAAALPARQDIPVTSRARDLMIEYVERQFPGLGAEPFAETPTVSVDTPDGSVLVEREEEFTIVSSPSGDGVNFAPLIGELVVDLLSGKHESASASFRRFDRA